MTNTGKTTPYLGNATRPISEVTVVFEAVLARMPPIPLGSFSGEISGTKNRNHSFHALADQARPWHFGPSSNSRPIFRTADSPGWSTGAATSNTRDTG